MLKPFVIPQQQHPIEYYDLRGVMLVREQEKGLKTLKTNCYSHGTGGRKWKERRKYKKGHTDTNLNMGGSTFLISEREKGMKQSAQI